MEEVLKQLNELCRDTLVDNLGMVFTAAGKDGWKPGCLSTGVPGRPDGALHGGANMALAETVGGALSSMSVPPENRFHVFGIEVNGNHMKQAQGGYVVAKGTFIHQGKRTHVVQVEIRDEYGTLVTVNRVTNMIV